VPEGVRADLLGDPGAAGDPADDLADAVTVELTSAIGEEFAAPLRAANSPTARKQLRRGVTIEPINA